jgi:hypothetical protein
MNAKRRKGKNRKQVRTEKFLFIEEIHQRAETMTPLLKEILDFRPPPRWD